METQRSLVDRWAEEYSDILKRVKEEVGLARIDQALELGSGEGAMVEAIRSVYPRSEITAIDSNPALASLPIYRREGINFAPVKAGEFLQTNRRPFDLITVALGDNLGIVLNDIVDHLTPNGVLIEWGCTIPGSLNSGVLESFDVGINDVRVWQKRF